MTLEIEWVLLMGLVGLVWVMVLAILDDNHRTHDKRQGSPSPDPHAEMEPRRILKKAV